MDLCHPVGVRQLGFKSDEAEVLACELRLRASQRFSRRASRPAHSSQISTRTAYSQGLVQARGILASNRAGSDASA
jgi:hypothetical protein